jgi:arylsulfatase A-like enzyme
VEQVDVMPTLLDLLGLPVPVGVQGRSLRALLEGRTHEHKDEVHAEICPPDYRNPYPTYEEFRAEWEAHHETPGHLLCWSAPFNVPGDYNKMVRSRTHKYIWYWDGQEELYDLQADPLEQHNRAGDPALAQVKAGLRCRLLEWDQFSEDPLDPRAEARLQQDYDVWMQQEGPTDE